MNITVLKGNLTRDPEINTLPSGDSVVNFSIAVNEYYNDSQGQQQKVTDYIDCKAYGRLAENINKFFSKGRPILISDASLKQERWTDQQTQQNRSKLIVKVKNFEFVDSKNDSSEGNTSSSKDKVPYEAEVDSDELQIDGVTV